MKHIINKLKYTILAIGLTATSCKKFVTIDNPPSALSLTDAYKENGTATSAVLGIYSYYYNTNALQYYTYIGGLESNDVQYQYAGSTPEMAQFQQSNTLATNSNVNNYLWIYPYGSILQANVAISGLTHSTTLTASIKQQLLGECYFMRAYHYFYMVNYFGGVPLSLSDDALSQASLARSTSDEVYAQIISDLKTAEDLLPATYTGTLRTRVNKYAVEALLARVYLYKKDYTNAVAYATKVIGASDVTYALADLSTAFKNNSNEVIFQFGTTYGYSFYGSVYRTTSSSGIPTLYLYPSFMSAFEDGDNRKTSWIDSTVISGTTYYRINKYKLATATAGDEYNVVLRLGEQYLIRAEAYAQLNDVTDAQKDLNAIRTRAGLGNTTAATQADLLTAIAQERRVELFGETAHRWFDLKRTGQANTVLSALKSTWTAKDTLMPIPYSQRLLNTKLSQNPGYE